MDLFAFLMCVCGVLLGATRSQGSDPKTNCPQPYVVEGQTFTCECTSDVTPGASFSWLGFSSTATLTVVNVTREQNGTVYVCQMEHGGQITNVSYTLRVAYGPSNSTVTITGPASFVTDGTRELALECQATDVYPGATFTWFHPDDPPRLVCIASGTANTKCSFSPRPVDDNMQHKYVCRATNTFTPARDVHGDQKYILSLSYPPQTSPIISTNSTQPLKQGSVITCKVTGGKPLVTSVTLTCRDPDLGPVIGGEQQAGSVSSSLVVSTSSASEVITTCTCSAVWGPEPGLYRDVTERTFLLQYRATILNFTINASREAHGADTDNSSTEVNAGKTDNSEVHVSETDTSSVTFTCKGTGRPPPVLTLSKRGADPLSTHNTSDSDDHLVHTLSNVSGEAMGTYVCEADNGFDDPNNQTVLLVVDSSPRLVSNSTRPTHPPVFTFTLVAHPTPIDPTIVLITNQTTMEGVSSTPDMFRTRLDRDPDREEWVRCVVTPVSVSQEQTGLHTITLNNDYGNLTLSFTVLNEVIPEDSTSLPVYVVVIIAGLLGLLLLVVAIAAVVCTWRRHGKNRKKPTGEDNKGYQGTPPPTSTHSFDLARLSPPRPPSTDVDGYQVTPPATSTHSFDLARLSPPRPPSTDAEGYAVADNAVNRGARLAPASSTSTLNTTTPYAVSNFPDRPTAAASAATSSLLPVDYADATSVDPRQGPQTDDYDVVGGAIKSPPPQESRVYDHLSSARDLQGAQASLPSNGQCDPLSEEYDVLKKRGRPPATAHMGLYDHVSPPTGKYDHLSSAAASQGEQTAVPSDSLVGDAMPEDYDALKKRGRPSESAHAVFYDHLSTPNERYHHLSSVAESQEEQAAVPTAGDSRGATPEEYDLLNKSGKPAKHDAHRSQYNHITPIGKSSC